MMRFHRIILVFWSFGRGYGPRLDTVVVVAAVRAQNPDVIPRAVDHIWRWMMGLSLIPATFAVVIRLSIRVALVQFGMYLV